MSEPETLPKCPKCGESGIRDKRIKDGQIRFVCSHCQEVWTLPENWQEPCKHPELSVMWGDDRAYHERENELHLKDGRYQKFITGEWKARDSGWGKLDAEGHQWLISIYCERCDFTIMSNDDEITRRLKSFELAIIKQVKVQGP